MKKKTTLFYKIIKAGVWLFSPKMKIYGEELLPEEPCIIVGNHTQMYGPITSELYIPREHLTWCAGEMMNVKTVPSYAFKDFWSQKPNYTHPFYRALSFVIAPLASHIFNNANTIAVHRDTRILTTFKATVNALKEGNNVVIFPEHDVKHNNIVYDFQNRFIDVARLYYKKTGKAVFFVPIYIAPNLKGLYFGNKIAFNPENNIDNEREKICRYLMDEITRIAVELPPHTVVPYRNIPKKLYPENKE